MSIARFLAAGALVAAGAFTAKTADAAHADVLVYSDGASSPTLLIGAHDFEDGDSFADIGLFEGHLEETTFFGVNYHQGDEPGANGVTTASGNLPTGGAALTGGDIFFDIATTTIDGSTGELFVWDDVTGTFGSAPSTYSMTVGSTGAVADSSSSNNAATGAWETVDSDGFFHKHQDFQLLDNDGDNATYADAGVYMLSLTARMAGYNSSLPFYLVLGAGLDEDSEEDEELLEAAAEYVGLTFGVSGVEEEETPVVPEPTALVVWAIGLSAASLSRPRRS